MNRGVFIKSLRELWPITLLLALFLALVECLLTYVLTTRQAEFSARIADIPFLQSFIKGLLGVETADAIGPGTLAAISWVHPVVLSLAWAHAIIAATRLPAGEIERGTIDMLLSLPLSRRELFVSDSLAWVVCGVVLIAGAGVGHFVGAAMLRPELRLPIGRVLIILVNLFAVHAAVAALASLLSALGDRRGRAIGAAFFVVVASFLINYLAQLWAPAERLALLSLLRYHRPLLVMRTGEWPVRDLAVLGAVALALWLSAGAVFARRDITTT